MTIRDLDRLISRTEITPVSKVALKTVRKAILGGMCGDASVGRGSWSVSLYPGAGNGMKMNFSFKREKDDTGTN